MAKKSDLKKQIEDILGHEIDIDAAHLPNLFVQIASYNFPEGYVATESVVLPLPKRCDLTSKLLDVSGVATTGNDGKRVLRLTDFICLVGVFAPPINVVATPLSRQPCFLTLEHILISEPPSELTTDVEIRVSTWDASGAEAPNVAFDWRCRVVYFEPIF